jgi:hypothetical protein
MQTSKLQVLWKTQGKSGEKAGQKAGQVRIFYSLKSIPPFVFLLFFVVKKSV